MQIYILKGIYKLVSNNIVITRDFTETLLPSVKVSIREEGKEKIDTFIFTILKTRFCC